MLLLGIVISPGEEREGEKRGSPSWWVTTFGGESIREVRQRGQSWCCWSQERRQFLLGGVFSIKKKPPFHNKTQNKNKLMKHMFARKPLGFSHFISTNSTNLSTVSTFKLFLCNCLIPGQKYCCSEEKKKKTSRKEKGKETNLSLSTLLS